MRLATATYTVIERFPPRVAWGLQRQLEKAAVSVPSNIAEGHARDSTKEFLHYISYALGSIAELETQILLAASKEFVTPRDADDLMAQADEVGKMLRAVQKTLKAKV